MTGRALFLDRDGVINVDHGYVHRPDQFEFIDGIFQLCRAAMRAGFGIVVVSNQAGIGRGLYSEAQYHALTRWMTARFADENVIIAGTYYCPYHPVHGVGVYKRESEDRKPRPGMIFRAAADLGLDLAHSALLGNQGTDIQAAVAAGIGLKMLFEPDPGMVDNACAAQADVIVRQLDEAVPLLEQFTRTSA